MMQNTTYSRAERCKARLTRLLVGCLGLSVLSSLPSSVDADAIKTRFNFNGNWVFKQFKQAPKQSVLEGFEERWTSDVPPWHREVMADIRIPDPLIADGDHPTLGSDSGTSAFRGDHTDIDLSTADRVPGPLGEGNAMRSGENEEEPDLTDNAFGHTGQEFFTRPLDRPDD